MFTNSNLSTVFMLIFTRKLLKDYGWLRISQSYDVDMSDVDTTLMLFAAATACSRTDSWQ